MRAATGPRPDPLADQLLVVDPGSGRIAPRRVADLPAELRPGDLLVLNDAFTWPASLAARSASGARIELRLAADLDGDGTFRVIALGDGDHRLPTEERGDPPPLAPGAELALLGADGQRGGVVRVVATEPGEPRWLTVRFDGGRDAASRVILRLGRPVQYAHVRGDLGLWDVQTPFAARPMAFEMPSAGRPLVPALLAGLRARGVAIVSLSHAAGLSSTGRPTLDARLPLPERYLIPEATAAAVARARGTGARVIAAGTTVARALEAAASPGDRGGVVVAPGPGVAAQRIDADTTLAVVDGLLTGIHEPGTSHFDLLRAFAPTSVLERALAIAAAEGFLLHEFGDSMLVLEGGPEVTTTRFSGTVPACPRPTDPTTSAPRW